MEILEAKQFLKDNARKGVDCPCCGQFVKIYKRKFNSGMARSAIYAYKIQSKLPPSVEYFHAVQEFSELKQNASTLEFSKLAYWGLVKAKPNKNNPHKKDSGLWKLTEKGWQFVDGYLQIKQYVFVFNSKVLGFSDEETDILNSLGNKFSYKELMKS